jgi:hypothetical protein
MIYSCCLMKHYRARDHIHLDPTGSGAAEQAGEGEDPQAGRRRPHHHGP